MYYQRFGNQVKYILTTVTLCVDAYRTHQNHNQNTSAIASFLSLNKLIISSFLKNLSPFEQKSDPTQYKFLDFHKSALCFHWMGVRFRTRATRFFPFIESLLEKFEFKKSCRETSRNLSCVGADFCLK